ncbi:MAG TPA: hypothetical protein VJ201_02760 [Candidatus Babeliales bacterium]|nr:hypothetical protein [Candidatus Babeliales bacterium]HLC06638.1 hypothetical protein [Candidatus Babeliales bacterium]
MKRSQHYFLPIAVICGIIFFVGITFIDTLYRTKNDAGMMMSAEVVRLRDIFHRIHKTCTIIDFDAQKNPINFLNVAKFAGSEVGPMNLVHPEKWEGPYLLDNPTLYQIAYQVVSTKKGYYITPGDGVELPNKKIVGKDIVLDQKANIDAMMINPDELMYKERPLAARLELGAPTNIQFFLNDDSDEA